MGQVVVGGNATQLCHLGRQLEEEGRKEAIQARKTNRVKMC